ncbi:ESS family glutamate:Na+ symporter [Haloactinospora alba]|uniref:ESS family glutamate:Na+ symporter n=1 Tax=Haloactinospora alba TaxID=405555 RepID=A0A543NNF2_9ACTN|nr:sodium/glutamate symporter [Haloactinospora alba]TQN33364.1 ESS family glutamate:Na+ symporter [Haloactinospora alba]
MFPTGEVSDDAVTTLLFSVAALGALLLAGVLLRLGLGFLRRLFLPAALIGGVLGAVLGPHGLGLFPQGMVDTWATFPGTLITVVFAPMLLGVRLPRVRETYQLVAPQLLFGYMGDLLLIGVPLLLGGILLTPFLGADPMFGTIIEVSWPGGHGTAGGMGAVYGDLGWNGGGDLALASATFALVFGIVVGMVLINWGARRGHLTQLGGGSPEGQRSSDIVPGDDRASSGSVTLNKDLVDNLAFHGALIAVAILFGWVLQHLLELLVPGMPLFPLAMIGGGAVQAVISRTRLGDAVDPRTLRTIQGWALDVLVVAAVASIAVPVILDNALPLVILLLASALVTVGFFAWAGPRVFRTAWFEQAIVNFGTLAAVASVGLMLLRAVDPELRTVAGRAYALRAPFFSPILGGGLVTALLPALASTYGPVAVGGVAVAGVAVLYVLARVLRLWTAPEPERQPA